MLKKIIKFASVYINLPKLLMDKNYINMKKVWHLFALALVNCFFLSCEKDNDFEDPGGDNDSIVSIPDKVALYFSEDGGKTFAGQYEGIRIGEYYWMNSNINHIKGHNVKREDIEKIFNIYGLDASKYNVSMDDFNKHFGSYYSRPQLENIVGYSRVYEGDEKEFMPEWSLPNVQDFQQLFGMCGDGRVDAVMRFLACDEGDNPAAITISGSSWVGGFNRNVYGFSLMPTGAIFNGPSTWQPYPGGTVYNVNVGDMYGLYQAVLLPAHGGITVGVHDYTSTDGGKMWHYLPMRWCRKLSDKELGYKLYINSTQTDIIKLDIDANPPSGYTELPNGYLRGFYVQYILDKEKPEKTVTQIVEMTVGLR